ncbi:MAG: methionine biosynthesis protein MetW, partial [Cypionkella sp.]
MSADLRPDLAVIAANVRPGARVLDIGCGSGELMAALAARGCDARGMEIDPALVERCVARGLSVVQGDATFDQRRVDLHPPRVAAARPPRRP